jgi:hypothetical protein
MFFERAIHRTYSISEATMNIFDKICAGLAFALGIGFLALGVFGLFLGCAANFTLPPIVGVLPAFVGWGIVRAVYLAWKPPDRPGGTGMAERSH